MFPGPGYLLSEDGQSTTAFTGKFLYIYIYILCIYIHMYIYHTSCVQVHELPQSHCGDNREGTLFS